MPHRVAVAVSGGRDSLALLHATVAAARPLGVEVHGLHVHHGLQADADAWAAQVDLACTSLGVVCHVERLTGRPGRGDSVEAWARRERYRALAAMAGAAGIGLVLLAHHRRDQAETFLLQALRGAGAAGLSAMPSHARRHGVVFARPWLRQPRERIEAFISEHGLAAIDDPSNDDTRFARNRLRRQVMPALRAAFDEAETALAASAAQAALAREAIDEWAAAELAGCVDGERLLHGPWHMLSGARRHWVLRAWLGQRLGRGAPHTLVERIEAEWSATGAGHWPVPGGGWLRSHQGRLDHAPAERAGVPAVEGPVCRLSVRGPGAHPVPEWHGVLLVRPADGSGVPLPLLADLTLAPRAGGERFRLAPGRPARSLKKQYQAAGVPAWSRGGPLVWAAGRLVFVPGLGLDAGIVLPAATAADAPRMALEWQLLRGDGGHAAGGR